MRWAFNIHYIPIVTWCINYNVLDPDFFPNWDQTFLPQTSLNWKMMWILWIRIRNNERLGRWVYEKGQTYGRSWRYRQLAEGMWSVRGNREKGWKKKGKKLISNKLNKEGRLKYKGEGRKHKVPVAVSTLQVAIILIRNTAVRFFIE